MINSLGPSFKTALAEIEKAHLPDSQIFLKLSALDPELPHKVLDDAFQVQSERRNQPLLREEFETVLKDSWKVTLRDAMERFGLGFLFKSKASPNTAPPQRIARNMHDTRPVPLSKPAAFSAKETKDTATIDMQDIGDDLRRVILRYLEEDPRLQLSPYEQKTLDL